MKTQLQPICMLSINNKWVPCNIAYETTCDTVVPCQTKLTQVCFFWWRWWIRRCYGSYLQQQHDENHNKKQTNIPPALTFSSRVGESNCHVSLRMTAFFSQESFCQKAGLISCVTSNFEHDDPPFSGRNAPEKNNERRGRSQPKKSGSVYYLLIIGLPYDVKLKPIPEDMKWHAIYSILRKLHFSAFEKITIGKICNLFVFYVKYE